jgi:glycosyltransferase involved in cell wall biosynthesis
MRVTHICNLPLSMSHPDFGKISTHPGRWVLNLALAQRNHTEIEPQLVVQVPGSSASHSTEVEGIPVHYLSAPDRLRAATFFQMDARRIAHFVKTLNPDIVHAHGTEDAYLLAAQATNLPHLITVQGCYFLINRELPPKLISRAKIVELTEAIALSRSKHAIAKSTYVANALKIRFPNLKISQIPNTFDPILLELEVDRPRTPNSIAFVGTVDQRKGVDLIARAAEILHDSTPDLTVHVFGSRPQAPSPYEAEQLRCLQEILKEHLILHGTIPALEVAKKLTAIELLIAPSREEMFGNQVIEALLAGTWPVVSSGTAMEENVHRVQTGTVFTNGNAESLAEAILKARDQLPAWNRTETRQRVLDWMGPGVVARQHCEVYRKVLGKE